MSKMTFIRTGDTFAIDYTTPHMPYLSVPQEERWSRAGTYIDGLPRFVARPPYAILSIRLVGATDADRSAFKQIFATQAPVTIGFTDRDSFGFKEMFMTYAIWEALRNDVDAVPLGNFEVANVEGEGKPAIVYDGVNSYLWELSGNFGIRL